MSESAGERETGCSYFRGNSQEIAWCFKPVLMSIKLKSAYSLRIANIDN